MVTAWDNDPFHCDTGGRHGVDWDVWNRKDATEGPWRCIHCHRLVEATGNGFAVPEYVIHEEPW